MQQIQQIAVTVPPTRGRPLAKTFGEHVRDLRIKRDLSQAEVGARAGHSAAWTYGIEANKSTPSPRDLFTLAETLDVTVRYLVFADEADDAEYVEFAAQITELGRRLDARGRRAVLTLARQQLNESPPEVAPVEERRRARPADRLDPAAEPAVEAMQRARDVDAARERGSGQPRRGRRAGEG